MKNIKPIYLIMTALMAIQCSSKDTSGSQGGCQAPLPQAIFDKDVSQIAKHTFKLDGHNACLLYTSPSPRDRG